MWDERDERRWGSGEEDTKVNTFVFTFVWTQDTLGWRKEKKKEDFFCFE